MRLSPLAHVWFALLVCALLLGACSKPPTDPQPTSKPKPSNATQDTPSPASTPTPKTPKPPTPEAAPPTTTTSKPMRERIQGTWIGEKAKLVDAKRIDELTKNYGPQGVQNMEASVSRAVQGQSLEITKDQVILKIQNGPQKKYTYTIETEQKNTIVLKTIEEGGKVVQTTIKAEGDPPSSLIVTDDDAIKGMEVTFKNTAPKPPSTTP